MKNLCNKTRDKENPYEIWRNNKGWEWRVLKKYQNEENEAKNQYARWFCAVKSPFTYGSFELGDVYVKDIKENATKIDISCVDWLRRE
jgi:hypothetical protein